VCRERRRRDATSSRPPVHTYSSHRKQPLITGRITWSTSDGRSSSLRWSTPGHYFGSTGGRLFPVQKWSGIERHSVDSFPRLSAAAVVGDRHATRRRRRCGWAEPVAPSSTNHVSANKLSSRNRLFCDVATQRARRQETTRISHSSVVARNSFANFVVFKLRGFSTPLLRSRQHCIDIFLCFRLQFDYYCCCFSSAAAWAVGNKDFRKRLT